MYGYFKNFIPWTYLTCVGIMIVNLNVVIYFLKWIYGEKDEVIKVSPNQSF